MHSIHAQRLEVLDSARLGQGKEFTLVLDTARLVDGEVPVVHLIDDEVLRRNCGTLVIVPTLRIGLCHVDNGSALAVGAHCGGPDTGALAKELAAVFHVEGVELALQVTLDGGLPHGAARLGATLHVDRLDGLAAQSILVDAQFHLLGVVVGLQRKGARAGVVVNSSASVSSQWYE